MTSRLLLVAAALAVAAAVPAVAEEPAAARADEASLPPLLVRWPLAPRARGEVQPAESGRTTAPERSTTAPRPRPPAPTPRPLEPVLEPAEPGGPLDREGPLVPPVETPGPEAGRLRLPVEAPVETDPGDRKLPEPPAVRPPGQDRETDLPSFLVPPPRLALSLGSFEVSPPTAELRRWTFPEQEGISWSSLESERQGDWVILTGSVDVRAGQDRIQADEVRLNEKTKQLLAEGNVVLDHLDSRLAGERMEFDLDTNTGTVWNAIGYARGDITFTGERVEKVGPNKYVVYAGSFTSCTQPLPIWQVKVSKAIVDVDEFVYLFNPRVLFKRVPASWFPWAAVPIKQERTTGFMVPKISSSSVRGLSVSEEFFWAINRSTDLTLGGQWWQDFGWSANVLGRWHLNGMSNPGSFEAIYVDALDPEEEAGRVLDDKRWYASFEHVQDVWEDWKLTVRGELGSDRLTQQQPFFDLEGNLGSPTPIFNQRVTLQRRWGKHSLSINLENDERENEQATSGPLDTGVRESTRTTRRLPEVEYRMSSVQLGGRTWAALQVESFAGYLHASEAVEYDGTLGGMPASFSYDEYSHDWYVADLYPQLRFPMGTPFFEIVPNVNLRATWWSAQEAESREPGDAIFDPDGVPMSGDEFQPDVLPTVEEGLFLWAWDAGIRVGGPDFQRIYRRAAEPGQRKWQHLIEPEIDFSYTPSIDREYPIAQDRRRNHYSSRFEKTGARAGVTLINTLRNKTVVPVGEKAEPARDWLIWRLSADYNFREKARSASFDDGMGGTRTEDSHWGDIRSDVNFRPTDDIRFSLRNTYDILQDDVTSTSLTGGLEGGWGYLDLAFTSRRDNRTLDDSNTELTLTGEHWFYKNDRIRIGYDFTKSFNGSVPARGTQRARSSWPYKRVVVSYFNQCCGVSLSWEDVDDRSVDREKEWTFIVSLKDVGNFLRLRQRSTSR